MKKTVTAALAVAVLSASAMFATTAPSNAGYWGGYGYYKPYYGYKHHCYYKKVKVWGYYGYFWKRIKVCH